MKLEELHLSGVGGIDDLTIPFDPCLNIICGPNGIGKTTILESIAHCFTHGPTTILKRNVNADKSQVRARVSNGKETEEIVLRFSEYEPNEHVRIAGRHMWAPYLLSFKTARTFAYIPLNAINRDTEKQNHVLLEEAKSGVQIQDVKNWFVNRYLYSAHPNTLSSSQLANFELAKRCFSALDPNVAFAHVKASTNEIVVRTPGGEIYYEYLSSGFKSCLSIMLGIIKETEFRLPESDLRAEGFPGLILIDELEMHLHPEWQTKIARVLTEIFPNIQFVVTTHSPHIIQSAAPNQIVALEVSGNRVALRPLPPTKYGFQGWTLDEVLTDVMGMTDTRSEQFVRLMSRFSTALDEQNRTDAEVAFQELETSLHPNNHTRKLLKLQLAFLDSADNDQA